jgi:hypothetical protein
MRFTKRRLRRELLELSGLGLELNGSVSVESLADERFMSWVSSNRTNLQGLFGLVVPAEPNVAWIRRMLDQMGLSLREKRTKIGGKNRRNYYIEDESRERMEFLEIRRQAAKVTRNSSTVSILWKVGPEGVEIKEKVSGEKNENCRDRMYGRYGRRRSE